MNLTDRAVTLKKRGHSQKEIAEKLGVTQQAVSLHLIKARKNGLWNGEEGLQPSYEEYLGKAKNSDMIGRPLTRDEWNDLWKDRKLLRIEKASKSGSDYYKCPQCMTRLIALDDVEFEPPQIHDVLRQNGITHLCKECLVGYRRLDRSVLREGKCFQCGSFLVEVFSEGESIGFYCKDCQLLFSKDELEKEGYRE